MDFENAVKCYRELPEPREKERGRKLKQKTRRDARQVEKRGKRRDERQRRGNGTENYAGYGGIMYYEDGNNASPRKETLKD